MKKMLRHLRRLPGMLLRYGVYNTALEALDRFGRITAGKSPHRFTRVAPGLYVGGQHTRRGLERLQTVGVTAVVSLRDEYDDKQGRRAPKRYLHLPTVDNTPPTLDDLRQGVAFIHEEINQGGSVYIHCRSGVGRAPTMAAAYLVSTGLTPAEAWAKIRAARPFIRPNRRQREQLERFAADS